MLRLDDIALFVRTAELGSLSAAARELDCSPAVASAALKRLEGQLQVRLLLRSTRSLRLTVLTGACAPVIGRVTPADISRTLL